MPTKKSPNTSHKRYAGHHRHSRQYKKVYWPYLPLLSLSLILLVISWLPNYYNAGQTLGYARETSLDSLLLSSNQQRFKHDTEPLRLNAELVRAAQAKADDMAARNYWSHQTPEGQEPWSFIDSQLYPYTKAGENLAYGFINSSAVIDGWMQSPTHRENLLDSDFTEVGFGFANADNFQSEGPETIVVALYARPLAAGAPAAGAAGHNQLSSQSDDQAVSINRAEAVFGLANPWISFMVGSLAGGSIIGLAVNHTLRLRRWWTKQYHRFAAHPLFDLSLLIMAVAAYNFTQAAGYML